ncbi:MAG TPA: hypothetical protein P5550_02260 [Bacteroidales bacterium]|nr:hypothetical protein [Bacteroidales bacterium]HRZ75847.1 hypothetical protein [Bacteroidales bacterium]
MKRRLPPAIMSFYLLLLLSCSHEAGLERKRVEPDAWFPAYPGSFWDYDTTVWNISDEYADFHQYSLPYFKQAGYYVFRSSLMHSVYAGLGHAGENTSPIVPPGKSSICSVSFVTFELSLPGGLVPDTAEIAFRRGMIVQDTSIVVLGKAFTDVKLVKEWSVLDTTHLYYDYFARDIGLVKREQALGGDPAQIVTILELHSFYINK